MKPSVFSCESIADYLRAVIAYHKDRNPNSSLRAVAKWLGYRAPSYLSHLLSGERPASVEIVQRLAQRFHLQPEERRYLQLLALRERASQNDRPLFDELLKDMMQPRESKNLSAEEFRVVSDWYHWVLIELIRRPDFREDHEVLSQIIGRKVSAATVRDAIDRLLCVRIVERTENGALKVAAPITKISSNVPNAAIREHHRQMMERALEAMEEQSMDERFFSGSTFALSESEVAEVRALVDELHERIFKRQVKDSTTRNYRVYRVNVQMFCLAKNLLREE